MKIADLKFDQAVDELLRKSILLVRITANFLGREWELHLEISKDWPPPHLVQGFVGRFGMVSPNVTICVAPIGPGVEAMDMADFIRTLATRWKYKVKQMPPIVVTAAAAELPPEKPKAKSKRPAAEPTADCPTPPATLDKKPSKKRKAVKA